MKKIIVSLVVAILAAILGILGFNLFKGSGPRERISGENDSKIIVEELSYYIRGDKVFGKVYKPGDENGNFPDSLGTRPVVVFVHEPLKTAEPEGLLKSLVSKGVIGYTFALSDDGKEIESIVRRVEKEKFTDTDLVFLVSDSYSADAGVSAASKLKGDLCGLILFSPSLEGKSLKTASKLGYEVLTIETGPNSSAGPKIAEYLELNGALK